MGIVIAGYHGTSRAVAQLVMGSRDGVRHLRLSANRYDWLGDGIYFFQDGPGRARRWAEERSGALGAVLQAEIDLGNCLDLIDTNGAQEHLHDAHLALSKLYETLQRSLPQQTPRRHDLDQAVINHYTKRLDLRGIRIDTVRAAFQEGDRLYPNAELYDRSHVQVAVRRYEALGQVSIV